MITDGYWWKNNDYWEALGTTPQSVCRDAGIDGEDLDLEIAFPLSEQVICERPGFIIEDIEITESIKI